MKTTESDQMNQNTELVKSLEELADAGPLIHCQSWSYIQRICMKSAVTLSTQERVIVELEKDAKRYRWLREPHLPPTTFVLTVVTSRGYGLWAKKLDEAIDSALSKGSGQ